MTLGELAKLLNGALHGPADLVISGPADVESMTPGCVVFAESEAFLKKAESGATALILPMHLTSARPHVKVDDARKRFFQYVQSEHRPPSLEAGIHPTAVVSPGARVHPQARLGPYTVVESDAEIGADTQVFAFAYIGSRCKIGERCTLHPHAVLLSDVELGPGTIVHSGAVLGADGFGYAWDGARQAKIPQVGRVALGRDVEVGALTAIDRATLGQTTIADGVKIDNLVQVAHNVAIGAHTVIASQSGIGGSSTLGERVALAGQVGVSDHVTISDGVRLGARAAALQDIAEPGDHMGTPARPVAEAKRNLVLATKLHEIVERLRRLERLVGKHRE